MCVYKIMHTQVLTSTWRINYRHNDIQFGCEVTFVAHKKMNNDKLLKYGAPSIRL